LLSRRSFIRRIGTPNYSLLHIEIGYALSDLFTKSEKSFSAYLGKAIQTKVMELGLESLNSPVVFQCAVYVI
jgi:hypothetical protein